MWGVFFFKGMSCFCDPQQYPTGISKFQKKVHDLTLLFSLSCSTLLPPMYFFFFKSKCDHPNIEKKEAYFCAYTDILVCIEYKKYLFYLSCFMETHQMNFYLSFLKINFKRI